MEEESLKCIDSTLVFQESLSLQLSVRGFILNLQKWRNNRLQALLAVGSRTLNLQSQLCPAVIKDIAQGCKVWKKDKERENSCSAVRNSLRVL